MKKLISLALIAAMVCSMSAMTFAVEDVAEETNTNVAQIQVVMTQALKDMVAPGIWLVSEIHLDKAEKHSSMVRSMKDGLWYLSPLESELKGMTFENWMDTYQGITVLTTNLFADKPYYAFPDDAHIKSIETLTDATIYGDGVVGSKGNVIRITLDVPGEEEPQPEEEPVSFHVWHHYGENAEELDIRDTTPHEVDTLCPLSEQAVQSFAVTKDGFKEPTYKVLLAQPNTTETKEAAPTDGAYDITDAASVRVDIYYQAEEERPIEPTEKNVPFSVFHYYGSSAQPQQDNTVPKSINSLKALAKNEADAYKKDKTEFHYIGHQVLIMKENEETLTAIKADENGNYDLTGATEVRIHLGYNVDEKPIDPEKHPMVTVVHVYGADDSVTEAPVAYTEAFQAVPVTQHKGASYTVANTQTTTDDSGNVKIVITYTVVNTGNDDTEEEEEVVTDDETPLTPLPIIPEEKKDPDTTQEPSEQTPVEQPTEQTGETEEVVTDQSTPMAELPKTGGMIGMGFLAAGLLTIGAGVTLRRKDENIK